MSEQSHKQCRAGLDSPQPVRYTLEGPWCREIERIAAHLKQAASWLKSGSHPPGPIADALLDDEVGLRAALSAAFPDRQEEEVQQPPGEGDDDEREWTQCSAWPTTVVAVLADRLYSRARVGKEKPERPEFWRDAARELLDKAYRLEQYGSQEDDPPGGRAADLIGTAALYICPEGGCAHGYSLEPWTCEGDHHEPVEATKTEFVSADWRRKAEHRLHEWRLRDADVEDAEIAADEAVAAKEMWRERANSTPSSAEEGE